MLSGVVQLLIYVRSELNTKGPELSDVRRSGAKHAEEKVRRDFVNDTTNGKNKWCRRATYLAARQNTPDTQAKVVVLSDTPSRYESVASAVKLKNAKTENREKQ